MVLLFTLFMYFAGISLPAQGRSVKRAVMMQVVEEEVNGVFFTHRIDTLDGSCRQVWAIEGKPVTEGEYLQRIAQEEVLEAQQTRRQEQQRLYEHQQFVAREQCAITRKLLQKEINAAQEQLNKVMDSRLEPYRVFSSEGFASCEVFGQFVQKFQEVQQGVGACASLSSLQESLEWLQPYKERIAIFYMNTVQAARERSDDTRLLKDLLQIVTH